MTMAAKALGFEMAGTIEKWFLILTSYISPATQQKQLQFPRSFGMASFTPRKRHVFDFEGALVLAAKGVASDATCRSPLTNSHGVDETRSEF
jgi:hypothetical protein